MVSKDGWHIDGISVEAWEWGQTLFLEFNWSLSLYVLTNKKSINFCMVWKFITYGETRILIGNIKHI